MRRVFFSLLLFFSIAVNAQQEVDSLAIKEEIYKAVLDSINHSFTYQTGVIELGEGLATLKVPEGFKFLDEAQSQRVLTDLWETHQVIQWDYYFPKT